MALHLGNAKFLKETGGMYLQILDQLKPYPRTVTPDECTRLGKLPGATAKRTGDLGIKIGYRNHARHHQRAPPTTWGTRSSTPPIRSTCTSSST